MEYNKKKMIYLKIRDKKDFFKNRNFVLGHLKYKNKI